MKRWITTGLGLCGILAFGSCVGDYPYGAPLGSVLTVNPESLQIAGPGGVYVFEALVVDEDGIALSNVQVTVKTYAGTDSIKGPNFVLVPETAIAGENSSADTSWQVEAAEQYFELTRVNDEIQPDYLMTKTDSRGIARVYFYPRCIPTDCLLVGYDWPINSCVLSDEDYYEVYLDMISTYSSSSTCEGQDSTVIFSIGVDAVEVTVTNEFAIEFENLE